MLDVHDDLPGYELVSMGLDDLAADRESESPLLVAMVRLGCVRSESNALVARVVSFARAAEHACAGWRDSLILSITKP